MLSQCSRSYRTHSLKIRSYWTHLLYYARSYFFNYTSAMINTHTQTHTQLYFFSFIFFFLKKFINSKFHVKFIFSFKAFIFEQCSIYQFWIILNPTSVGQPSNTINYSSINDFKRTVDYKSKSSVIQIVSS